MPQAIMHIHKYRHRFSFAIPKPCLKIKQTHLENRE